MNGMVWRTVFLLVATVVVIVGFSSALANGGAGY